MNDHVPPCQLHVEAIPQTGQRNMQLDGEMLQQVVDDESASIVRIYRWDRPTVSLGYFQKQDEHTDPRLQQCDRVHRVTGGGAILHDDELTYSCAVPAVHPIRSHPTELYCNVHSAIISALHMCGASCAMRKDTVPSAANPNADEPFLCFLRADPRDVVLKGHKVLGSAQRRRKGAILQHGSILLRHSTLTPEIPGIIDLCPDFDVAQFTKLLPTAVARAVADDIC